MLGNNGLPPPPLGDRLEAWLTAQGITQEKYQAFKAKFGLAPTCHCDQRKEWLNQFGAWFGVGLQTDYEADTALPPLVDPFNQPH